MKPRAFVMFLVALTMAAQSAKPPGTKSEQEPAAGNWSGTTKTYINSESHLTFTYPAELKPLAALSVAEEGRRLMYGEDTTPDSDQSKLPPCTTPLLAVGTGSAPGSSTGAQASIALFEVDPRCIPQKVLKNQKAANPFLKNVTKQGVTFLGMAPIEDPTFYPIQNHRVYFASAQGTPVTRTDVQAAGSELTAVAATWINGQVLAWVIEADSVETFNRLLASQVDFGAGKPQALYASGFAAPANGPAGP